MKRRAMVTTRLGTVGLVALVTGGALFGAAITAGAASSGCASSCSISATQTTGLDANTSIQVTGSGFTPKATGAVVECNLAPGEPTIAIPADPPFYGALGSLPVSCSVPAQGRAPVSKSGTISDSFIMGTGTTGPPVDGTDSSGGQASADAAQYPCPPTQAQVAAGVACAMVYQDSRAETASIGISFVAPYTTTTTTTTTTTAPAPAGCTPTSAANKNGPPTMTVNPGTCLVGGEKVQVSATGLKANQIGAVLECNTATGEPTVFDAVANQGIPVGCSDPLKTLAPTNGSGVMPSTTFVILTGTIGPPVAGTDSANRSAATDAANYPCPPTPAQEASGATCDVIYGDAGGDQVLVPVTFGANPGVTGNNPGGGSGGSTSSAGGTANKAALTAASASQLAFTGAGNGLRALALIAVVLLLAGGSLLLGQSSVLRRRLPPASRRRRP